MESAPSDGGNGAGQLTLFRGAGSHGAAVTAREFFDAASRIDKLLFAGEKRMARSANADSNVRTRRTGVVNRAARADDIAFLVIRMNARFHGREGTKNLSRVVFVRKG